MSFVFFESTLYCSIKLLFFKVSLDSKCNPFTGFYKFNLLNLPIMIFDGKQALVRHNKRRCDAFQCQEMADQEDVFSTIEISFWP